MTLPLSLDPLIAVLQSWPIEGIGGLTFLISGLAIITLARYMGESGLYVYTAIAVVASNLHVLKAGYVAYLPEPIALGTTIFSSTYLVGDLLTERYGAASARRNAFLGFAGAFLLLLFMVLALGVKPLVFMDTDPASGIYRQFNAAHNGMLTLFNPSLRILLASLVSYGVSQMLDISLFAYLKGRTGGRLLWMRTFVSMALSALLDISLFSVLAWVVLSPHPVPLETLFFTYILGSYMLRLLIIIGQTPLLSLAVWCIRQDVKG